MKHKKKNLIIIVLINILFLFTINNEINISNKDVTIKKEQKLFSGYSKVGTDIETGKYTFIPNKKGIIICAKNNNRNLDSIIFCKEVYENFEFIAYYGQYIKYINGEIRK